jgi:glycosyltransferase involved in cell wall biosynthesis
MKNKIIFIKSNTMEQEVTRIPKEFDALKQENYEIIFLSWDRKGQSARQTPKAKGAGYKELRFRLKAPFGIKILPFLPIWWLFVAFKLLVTKWDLAHVTNFDSLIPVIIAGKLKRKPVIYEIVDVYADMILLPSVIRAIGIGTEKLFMRFVDAVIIIDEGQIKEFGGIPNSKIITVYDTPPETFKEIRISQKQNETFTVYYGGVFYKARHFNLDKIVAAIKDIDDIKFVISGLGDQVDEIREWSCSMPDKVEFLGFISQKEVWQRSCTADLLLVARTPAVLGHIYNCGSTFLRAMMCGRPFLANKGTATADKVIQENCGLVVKDDDINEIKAAIIKLKKSPKLRRELGANARKAYEQRYRWEIMAQRLITLYRDIIGAKR